MSSEKKVGTVSMDMILNSNAFEQKLKQVNGLVKKVLSVAAITKFSTEAISAATKVQSAWTGLNSIVQGTGKSFSAAEKFISTYTKDGLVSIQEATTAYKNLLARGYDTTQIENTMNALKDSAAFGRQASYDLGEAVVSATEGLKNENSILVDNAGVTKNVDKMWEEYAKAHNTTTNAMTQAEKVTAEYEGILKETRFQIGDASTYTKAFGGRIQMLKMSFTTLTIAVGKVVTPIAQLFIPVINTAVVALTNFFNKLQQVLKAFNLDIPNVVKNTNANIAQIGENASDSATQAVKAAKKITNAFADVDEIHTVNMSSGADSTDASTENDSTGIAIEPTVASDSSVSNAVSATVEKIKKYIEPLQNIDFNNLINAFANLKEALNPFTTTFFEGLNWFYFDILVPLASWTIEDVLPAFLNILSGALNVLNAVIQDFKPVAKWLWDKFLEPVGKWTGGIIISVLNGIGDALKWISENEIAVSILEGLAAAIVLVGTALKVWKIIKTLTDVGNIANALIATSNLLGVAFTLLTSPITLVVLGITALIAVIILCIKHWDDIKNAASKCWAGIKSAWGSVSDWFRSKVVNPIKILFSGLRDAMVNAFKAPLNNIIGGLNTFILGINKIKIPDWVPGVGGFGFNFKPIQMLAQGKYVSRNNPQLAIVGDNKREGEVITPESKIYEQQMKALKDAEITQNSGGIAEIHFYVHYEDGKTVIKKINQTQIEAGEILLLT